ncbi:hypothetical protein [Arthrobacter sp. ISL-72]|uniref:hypothetical protein n=1 Tax=Arthrobacter sp. ISL-72 TaxID=2819114 RepID=UPI001BEAAA2D|nr:hypothetical protein [Arthrobacter sp. ISL-72]MBT2596401.1 hypothetical protein [Arthrobacter sp. ISL-72]
MSWFLLAVLVVGAASYVQGARYGLATAQAKPAVLDYLTAPGTSLPAETGVRADRTSTAEESFSAPAAAVPVASPARDYTREHDCCGPRPAPRSEPAPLRTVAPAPPAGAPTSSPGGDGLFAVTPQDPDLPVLTVIQLSISRT